MRKLIWISGSEDWCNLNIKALIDYLPIDARNIIYCGSDNQSLTRQQINISSSSKRGQIEKYLGTQCSVLIVNCFSGFNPELFCALCGTVQSPGIIFLLSPEDSQWPTYPDPDYVRLCSFGFRSNDVKGRFIHYFIHKLKTQGQSESIISIAENECSNDSIKRIHFEVNHLFINQARNKLKTLIITENHHQVINWIKNKLASNTPGLLILSGKRGRGKSTVLGVALKSYANSFGKPVNVCVVSQTRSNIRPLIKQLCPQETVKSFNQITHRSLSLSYCPPDEYLKTKQEIELLIVDEAAAIPLPQLYRMLESCPKIILSTTTDGYEGTGKGFTSKLKTRLARYKNPITHHQLTQSLRWSENDPIEQFLQKSLLLDDSDISAISNLPVKLEAGDLKFEKLDRNDLVFRTEITDQIYSLLSLAHYRTTPDDLRFILDAPDIEIWIAHCNETIYAAMMIGREGGLPEELHEDIWLGLRRLRGHLLPQCLSAQCGFKTASAYYFKRILRIAVYQPYRNIGIGKNLVNNALRSEANNNNLDYYGVSFGFEDNLVEFWRTLGFFPVQLGYRENARSGERSVLMLKPISARAIQMLTCLRQRYWNEVNFMSSQQIAFTQSDYTHRYNHRDYCDQAIQPVSRDQDDIYSFAFGHRQFAHCHRILSKYANLSLNNNKIRDLLCADQIKLLTFKILQNKSWKNCADLLGYTGKKQTQVKLRGVFAIIYTATWGNKS